LKQERYIKHIHENIAWVEKKIKNLSAPKVDIKKSFTKEDLKNVLENLSVLKNIINENKSKLNNTVKQKEEKLKNLANINKKIEMDLKENEKLNKMLIFKKNELKRLIKNTSMPNKIENKVTKKIVQGGDISHLLKNKNALPKDYINYLENAQNKDKDLDDFKQFLENQSSNNKSGSKGSNKPKLFSKNNKSNENEDREESDKEMI